MVMVVTKKDHYPNTPRHVISSYYIYYGSTVVILILYLCFNTESCHMACRHEVMFAARRDVAQNSHSLPVLQVMSSVV